MKAIEIDILGTPYDILFGTCEELGIGEDLAGDCDFYTKRIRVRSDSIKCDTKQRFETYIQEVMAHEISHAILYESGLVSSAEGENMVEWLSIVAFKLVDTTFKALKLMEVIK